MTDGDTATTTAAASTSTDKTQIHIVTGIGGAIGASAAFALTSFGVLPASIPSAFVEAAGAGLGAGTARGIDKAITESIQAALKDLKSTGGVAAIYYALGMLPLQNIGGGFLVAAATPVKGFAAGALASMFLFA